MKRCMCTELSCILEFLEDKYHEIYELQLGRHVESSSWINHDKQIKYNPLIGHYSWTYKVQKG